MHQTSNTIILLINDALISEGLKLLLEDMQFTVQSTGTYHELEQLLTTIASVPSLAILPITLTNDKPVTDVINNIRKKFNKEIPAILFYSEIPTDPCLTKDSSLILLPEQIKPKELRNKIKQLSQQF